MLTVQDPPRTAPPLQDRLFEAIDGANWSALPKLFDANCVYERPGYDPIVGIDELMEFYQHERIIAKGKHSVERVARMGDVLFCEGEFNGVSRSGQVLQERFVDRYLLLDGHIKHRQTYFYRAAI